MQKHFTFSKDNSVYLAGSFPLGRAHGAEGNKGASDFDLLLPGSMWAESYPQMDLELNQYLQQEIPHLGNFSTNSSTEEVVGLDFYAFSSPLMLKISTHSIELVVFPPHPFRQLSAENQPLVARLK